MNKIKKIILVVLIFMSLFLLTGCEEKRFGAIIEYQPPYEGLKGTGAIKSISDNEIIFDSVDTESFNFYVVQVKTVEENNRNFDIVDKFGVVKDIEVKEGEKPSISINDIQWIEPEWKVDEEFQEQFEKRVFIGDKSNRYLEVPIKVRDPFQVGAKPSKYSQLYVRFNSHGSTWGKNSDGWRNMTLKFENLKVAGEHVESYRLYYPYIASEKFGLPEDTRYAIRPIMQNFKVKWE